ncbi:MAG TPA: PLP-dependent aminotransferase family protein [Gammaproteobacteria bacterium]|nr:PLP-dependent aminotransferase family protein [Gammaproteobacteria bacterium]
MGRMPAARQDFLYDRVSRHVLDLIEGGTLQPGDRAPSLRGLSRQLRVSISTVKQAYAELEARGVLRVRPQSGFYVNGLPQPVAPVPRRRAVCCKPRRVRFGELFEEIFLLANNPEIVPLGAAVPSPDLMPVKGLLRATRRAAGLHAGEAVDYCFPPGLLRLRRQIARRYAELGIGVSPEEVVITSGATEALTLALQTVARRGDIVAVESPTYFSVLRLIERMGLLAVEIDTDPETGMDPDALEMALETMEVRAVLTVPHFSNPLGASMPEAAKRRIAELVAEHDVALIEDDIYGDLYFEGERPLPLRGFDEGGKVITCSSFSKTLAPGYRVGWVLAGSYLDDVLEWKQATTSATASLTQLGVSEYLRSGEYERHLRRLRRAFRDQVERMRMLVARHFPKGTRITRPGGGFVLWVEMPRSADCLEVFHRALEEGISITPGILFSATRRYRNFIRINCGHTWSREIERAVVRLGHIVARQCGD